MSRAAMRRWSRLLAGLSLAVNGSVLAQASPVSVYEGAIGEAPVEIVLIHDERRDGISGHLFDRQTGRYLVLEETPHRAGDDLLVNLMTDARMPGAALLLPRLVPAQQDLNGHRVDLRTRQRQVLRARRIGHFSDQAREAYSGMLLQPHNEGDFVFRVQARRAHGEQGGRVGRIEVTRRDGTPVQTLDGLELVFVGTETLRFGDFDGDGNVDFRVTPLVRRGSDGATVAGKPHYYLYRQDQDGYRRHPGLETLAAQGALTFGSGGVVNLRPDRGIDYRAGTIEWQHYRFVAPDVIALERSSQETF